MATAETRWRDLALAAGTRDKLLLTLLTGNIENLTGLATTDKSNVVAALNEVRALALAAAQQGGAQISDVESSATKTWSSQKIASEMATALQSIVGAAPTVLDTLAEIANALENNPNIIATLTAGLGVRLRFDAAQTLTAPQQAQARANIGAQAASEIGNPDVDLVAVYTTALA
jgi:hypothetical protein